MVACIEPELLVVQFSIILFFAYKRHPIVDIYKSKILSLTFMNNDFMDAGTIRQILRMSYHFAAGMGRTAHSALC